jgi:ribosomal protein L11 methyltransferase
LSNAPEPPPNALWQIRLTAPAPAVGAIEAALEAYAFSISSFEDEKGGERTPLPLRFWHVTALMDTEPAVDEIALRLAETAGRAGIPVPDITVEPLPPLDWLAENRRHFPPQRLGRFFVIDPTEAGSAPAGAWVVRLAAGPAFGSGTHATTRGCLAAIAAIAKRRGRAGLVRVLDIGTGSGILAIAAARAGGRRLLASDVDPWAVRTARENARRNLVARRVRVIQAAGVAPRLARGGPYDLVLANILAAPLRKMMPELARILAPGGRLVLSGLLADQEAGVRDAARAHGLRLEARIPKAEWPTLIVRKASVRRPLSRT